MPRYRLSTKQRYEAIVWFLRRSFIIRFFFIMPVKTGIQIR
jgi:hypothetical protein